MLRECIYGECARGQHIRRTLTLTHTITVVGLLSKWKCRTCAQLSVQLDKSRVEKDFTSKSSVPNTETRLCLSASNYNWYCAPIGLDFGNALLLGAKPCVMFRCIYLLCVLLYQCCPAWQLLVWL